MKDFPHVSSITDYGHFSVDPERIDSLRPRDRQFDYRKCDQKDNERVEPVFVKTCQEAVDKDPGCD